VGKGREVGKLSLGQTWGYDFTMHLDEFAQRKSIMESLKDVYFVDTD
jgi:hypothetical protein